MTKRDFREIEAELNLSEDGTLKFHFVPSLKKLALAKVGSLLWMSQIAQQEIVNLFHSGIGSESDEFDEKWEEIKDNIIDKVSELCLPKTISIALKETVLGLSISILHWIEYHDKFMKIYFKNSRYSAADLIRHVTWTDSGKIDLAKTAKNTLADQGNSLSDDQKYKIACTYCLKDEIAIFASKVVNQDYLRSININTLPMVYYWTRYIIGDNNINIHEYIIKLLLTHEEIYSVPDEIYMSIWNKLSEQKRAEITPSIVKFGGQDSLCSLLSNLDYQQQQDIFKNCSGHILHNILNDWFREEYFLPVALHVLEIMHPKCYHFVLCEIDSKMHKGEKFKDYFVILWQRSSRDLKDYIFDNEMASFLHGLFSWERHLDLIDLMFKDASNAQQRKQIIFDEACMEKCLEFIQNDEWFFLETLMKYTLSSEEDIIEFKKTFTRLKGGEIAFNCLSHEAYDKIKPFMDWAFKSKEEGDRFRQTLVRDAGILMHSFIENPKKSFTRLENYFTWCANGDLELINKFKSEIPIHEPYLIKELITESQYELLDQLLNWCYLGNQQRIDQFKCNIADYDDMHVDDDDMHVDDDDDSDSD